MLWILAWAGTVCVVFVVGVLATEGDFAFSRWPVRAYHELVPLYRQVRLWFSPPGGRYIGPPPDPASGTLLTPAQRERIALLEAIGYDAGTQPAPAHSGVTIHDPERAHDGINLFSDGHAPEAVLMEMTGRVLHRWAMPFERAFPEAGPAHEAQGREHWRRVRLLPDGELLAIYEGNGLVRLDARSRLLWAYDGGAHHDVDVAPDGRIYVLTRQAEIVPRLDEDRPVLHDFIAVLDHTGRELSRLSLLEAIERSDYATALTLRLPKPDTNADLLHTNTLEILDGSLSDVVPEFAAGNVLISIRELSVIAVVDMERRQLVWAQSGVWVYQHQPTVLRNGNLLLFDNYGNDGTSQVLELEPATMRTVWAYPPTGRRSLFTPTCGSNQRLPNGNTLITESDRGRALEVTRKGEIVWEFVTPHRAGPEGEMIATLFEVVRLPSDHPLDWLRRP